MDDRNTERLNDNHEYSEDLKKGTHRLNDKTISLNDSSIPNNNNTNVIKLFTLINGLQFLTIKGLSYKVVNKLVKNSGEAELYIIEKESRQYAFKHYLDHIIPNEEILRKLLQLSHNNILKLYDYGIIEGRYYELQEYLSGGSIINSLPIKDFKNLAKFVAQINEALHTCHINNIIHRDLKPDNLLFRSKQEKSIVLSDFGISILFESQYQNTISNQSRTALYAAPEIYHNIGGHSIISKEIDYYALGMTIYYLWEGKNPLGDLNELALMNLKNTGKIRIVNDMPSELKILIKGLLISNPLYRWGYNEITKWLNGELPPIQESYPDYSPDLMFSKSLYDPKYPVFSYSKDSYGRSLIAKNPKELAVLMLRYNDLGKSHLFGGTILDWIKNVDQTLFLKINDIVKIWEPKSPNAAVYLTVYALDPELPFEATDGCKCYQINEIANALERNFDHYKEALKDEYNEFYLYLIHRGNRKESDIFFRFFQNYSPHDALNKIILFLEGSIQNIDPQKMIDSNNDLRNKIDEGLCNPNSKYRSWLYDLFKSKSRSELLKFTSQNFPNNSIVKKILEAQTYFNNYRQRLLIQEYLDIGLLSINILLGLVLFFTFNTENVFSYEGFFEKIKFISDRIFTSLLISIFFILFYYGLSHFLLKSSFKSIRDNIIPLSKKIFFLFISLYFLTLITLLINNLLFVKILIISLILFPLALLLLNKPIKLWDVFSGSRDNYEEEVFKFAFNDENLIDLVEQIKLNSKSKKLGISEDYKLFFWAGIIFNVSMLLII